MCTLSLATGVAVWMEVSIKDRFEDIQDRMMYDTVSVGRGGDQTSLWARDFVRRERAGAVGARAQLALQTKEVTFLLKVKTQDNFA